MNKTEITATLCSSNHPRKRTSSIGNELFFHLKKNICELLIQLWPRRFRGMNITFLSVCQKRTAVWFCWCSYMCPCCSENGCPANTDYITADIAELQLFSSLKVARTSIILQKFIKADVRMIASNSTNVEYL